MSTRWSTFSPRACSGDMYSGVPNNMPVRRQLAIALGAVLGELGDAEVEDLHEVFVAEPLDEVDVLGLEVAVDDAVGVGGGQGRADLQEDRGGCARRRGPPA
jgi:hypothetical protein